MAMGEIGIFVVGDQAIVREGVKRLLADVLELRVAGEASSATEAIDRLRREHCNVLLLGVSRSGPDDGLEALRSILHHDPQLPVLVLSMYPEEQYALRLLKAGARGYLDKQDASGELAFAIRRVADGGHYVGTALAKKLGRDVQHSGQPAAR